MITTLTASNWITHCYHIYYTQKHASSRYKGILGLEIYWGICCLLYDLMYGTQQSDSTVHSTWKSPPYYATFQLKLNWQTSRLIWCP